MLRPNHTLHADLKHTRTTNRNPPTEATPHDTPTRHRVRDAETTTKTRVKGKQAMARPRKPPCMHSMGKVKARRRNPIRRVANNRDAISCETRQSGKVATARGRPLTFKTFHHHTHALFHEKTRLADKRQRQCVFVCLCSSYIGGFCLLHPAFPGRNAVRSLSPILFKMHAPRKSAPRCTPTFHLRDRREFCALPPTL